MLQIYKKNFSKTKELIKIIYAKTKPFNVIQ